ncbi:hypothetical protein MI149_30085 (plasmid) [Mycolicibacterium crocinum]|uniref:Uncharacterized protein n=1 Tax=Mycolicibacterium crocinum TaxID=388459 RepID=A0ABY3TTG4_9MYCO|nr:hypothetical protein [Mycolicibacterium crocinum]ULN44746.1 hypothetical protein MI149_30085 [Mycolicibacterium crocinum]
MKPRRGPWLSGLLVALAVLVWMVGQVIGGMFAMTADMLSSFPSGPGPGTGSAASQFAP